jgi:hypothetical protein
VGGEWEESWRRVRGGLEEGWRAERAAGREEPGRSLGGAKEGSERCDRANQSVSMQEQVAESQVSENLGPQPVCRLAKAAPSAVLWLHTNLVWAGFSRSSRR